MTDVDDFLAHYASKYYDPDKARAYYLRTRELKPGSGSTAGLGKDQRAAVSVAKSEISKERKAESEALKTANVKTIETLRSDAKATRDRITKKLMALTAKLTADLARLDQASDIPPPKLNAIPDSASPKQRELLEAKNARITQTHQGAVRKAEQSYRGKASMIGTRSQETQKAVRREASAEMKKVGEGLKAAITKARADYTSARAEIKTKYDNATDTEVENIRNNIAGDPPKTKKPTKAK